MQIRIRLMLNILTTLLTKIQIFWNKAIIGVLEDFSASFFMVQNCWYCNINYNVYRLW